jgi:hypothetical protein
MAGVEPGGAGMCPGGGGRGTAGALHRGGAWPPHRGRIEAWRRQGLATAVAVFGEEGVVDWRWVRMGMRCEKDAVSLFLFLNSRGCVSRVRECAERGHGVLIALTSICGAKCLIG